MTQATDVKIGDILTADSTWEVDAPGQLFVILAKDGSRRIDEREWMSASFPQLLRDRLLEQSDSWLCWGQDVNSNSAYVRKGQYLPYFEQLHYSQNSGPRATEEPVNQIPYLEGYDIAQDPADRFFGWERYICTFAHDLMALPSHTYQHLDHNNLNLVPDLPHTDESNVRYKNTWHYGRAMLGYVLTRLDDWKALPMGGAENAFGLTWQNRKEGMEWIMRSICAQCESPFWARQFLVNHPIDEWQAVFDPEPANVIDTGSQTFNIYDVKLVHVDIETWAPKTGPTDFFVSHTTTSEPAKLWRGWSIKYKDAISRYDKKYATRSETHRVAT